MIENGPSFDKAAFLSNYEGMEDLAYETVDSFLESLPNLTQAIERAIQNKDPLELEVAAHTLKGAISNFFAEPSKLRAWQLEQLGRGKALEKAENAFSTLKIELDRLAKALSEFSNGNNRAHQRGGR